MGRCAPTSSRLPIPRPACARGGGRRQPRARRPRARGRPRDRLDRPVPRRHARRRPARRPPPRSPPWSACAAAQRIAVVPQGGNTGLVGGGVPLARRGGAEPAPARRASDRSTPSPARSPSVPARRSPRVQRAAGRRRARLRRRPRRPAARRTVGGTIATNAGGVHVLRYGGTRGSCVGRRGGARRRRRWSATWAGS